MSTLLLALKLIADHKAHLATVATHGDLEDISTRDEKLLEEWIYKAEQYLHVWIVRGILTSEKRAAHFRALGRGWDEGEGRGDA